MGGCSSQSVARSLAIGLLGALVACSSGSGGGERHTEGGTAPAPTSAPPPTIDLSRPIPGGSLHGTPRPPLDNTGTDYVAVLSSIAGNFRWLTENPDLAVLQELYVQGTETYEFQVSFFSALAQRGLRGADDGYRLLSTDVVDERPDVVTLRVRDEFMFERVVDAQGNQVGDGRPRNPTVKTWNVVLNSDATRHWRVASWTEVADTVQL
jgi:hypothetical protein